MKVPPKLVCLESRWNERLFQTAPVKGFFESMAPLLHPPLIVAHRFVESEQGLAHYAKRGGVLWRQAACNVLRGREGEAFAKRFLKATGVRAVIG